MPAVLPGHPSEMQLLLQAEFPMCLKPKALQLSATENSETAFNWTIPELTTNYVGVLLLPVCLYGPEVIFFLVEIKVFLTLSSYTED